MSKPCGSHNQGMNKQGGQKAGFYWKCPGQWLKLVKTGLFWSYLDNMVFFKIREILIRQSYQKVIKITSQAKFPIWRNKFCFRQVIWQLPDGFSIKFWIWLITKIWKSINIELFQKIRSLVGKLGLTIGFYPA